MPYDQKENPKMDVSGSPPIQKPAKAPPPAPKEMKIEPDDESITKLAYDLNEEKSKLQEEKQTRGKQAGFSQKDCEDIVGSD
ncbi:hypothetical protein LJC49_06035 [Ruminococcaceae bacterium OttesenSCG-928-I18]|nr:hypothetical protein [Ruminococcaceae bacterium OttesenSCG-928-I18]